MPSERPAVPRILRVIPSIDPGVGGPSFHLVNAARAETRAGRAITTVVCTRGPGEPDPGPAAGLRAEGIGFRTFERPALAPEQGLRWGVSVGLARWILRHAGRFDVLHVDYVWSFGGVAAVLAGRLWSRPVVLTPHESLTGFGIATSRSPLRARQKLLARRLLLSCVARVVVASRLEAEESDLDPARTSIVAHPIDDGSAGEAAPRPAAAGADAPLVVGFLGRLHPKKRLEALLEAARDLPGVRVEVAGDRPPERFAALQEEVAALADPGAVLLHGFVSEEGRDAFFARIDVLAMPSSFECFGMAAAEAMTAGVPVVVSDHVGIADVVRRHGAGVVVPLDDPGELRAALQGLARDRAGLPAMGDAARDAARSAFSYAAYGREIGRVYDEVRVRGRRRLPRMSTLALQRRRRQAEKLVRLLGVPAYRRALRHGVAATVEHRDADLPRVLATVVDVGANRGQFAVMAAHRWPSARLICFEPLPEPRGRLERVLAGHPALRVVDAAAGEEAGTAEFHVTRSDDSSSLLRPTATQTAAFPDSVEVDAVQVRVVRLDEELAEGEPVRPALLKIDVQGAELSTLRGAVGVLDRFDAILVECSFTELYAGQALASDVVRFLDDHGFVLTGMGDPSTDATGRTLQSDLVFGPRSPGADG